MNADTPHLNSGRQRGGSRQLAGLDWLKTELGRIYIASIAKPPAIIDHYTTLASLEKILASRTFIAGDATTSNDVIEHIYGRQIIGMILADYALKLSEQSSARHLAEFSIFQIDEVLKDKPRCFLACFSGAPHELLDQWRAYGDGGRGVAIGIDALAATAGDQAPSAMLHQVVYQESEQARSVADLLAPAEWFANKWLSPNTQVPDAQLTAASTLLSSHLAGLIPRLKNKWFESEKEWRFVQNVFPGDATQIVTLGGRDYVHLRLGKGPRLPIVRIMLGPLCSQADEDRVTALLRERGYDGVDVRRSVIPYRG